MNEAALLLLIEIVWEHFYSKNSALQKWIVVQTSTNVVSMCLNNTQDLYLWLRNIDTSCGQSV